MLYDKIQLEADEEVLAETRRHWFIPFGQLLSLCIAAILPFLLFFFVRQFTPLGTYDLPLADYAAYVTFAYGCFLLFLWIRAFTIWTNYYLDIMTLTNNRILLINQKGFFHRNIGSFRLERLQDMNIEINGLIATMLDFGNLEVETAGSDDEEFRATGLPHPRELKAKIIAASDKSLNEHLERRLGSDGV